MWRRRFRRCNRMLKGSTHTQVRWTVLWRPSKPEDLSSSTPVSLSTASESLLMSWYTLSLYIYISWTGASRFSLSNKLSAWASFKLAEEHGNSVSINKVRGSEIENKGVSESLCFVLISSWLAMTPTLLFLFIYLFIVDWLLLSGKLSVVYSSSYWRVHVFLIFCAVFFFCQMTWIFLNQIQKFQKTINL